MLRDPDAATHALPQQRTPRPGDDRGRGRPPGPDRDPAQEEPGLLARLPGLRPALRPDGPEPHPAPDPRLRPRAKPRARDPRAPSPRSGGALPAAPRAGVLAHGDSAIRAADLRRHGLDPADRGPLVQRGRRAHPLVVAGPGNGLS